MTITPLTRYRFTLSRRRPTETAERVLQPKYPSAPSSVRSLPVSPTPMSTLVPPQRVTRRVDAQRQLLYRALYATLRRTRVRWAVLRVALPIDNV
jgi:hypothetical protein